MGGNSYSSASAPAPKNLGDQRFQFINASKAQSA